MKLTKYMYIPVVACLALGTTGCNSFLEEKVYTEYDPNAMLQEQSGLDALLAGAYSRSRIISYTHRNFT